jgi:hypothetical protein
MHPTVVPIPLAITVRDKSTGATIGTVSAEEVREKLKKWDEMVAAYQAWGDPS